MQPGVQGPLLDLQDIIRSHFDGLGDAVAVGGTQEQGAEDQQVQRALEQFDAFLLFFGRHTR